MNSSGKSEQRLETACFGGQKGWTLLATLPLVNSVTAAYVYQVTKENYLLSLGE